MNTIPIINLPILHCARCGHTWIPRRPQPPKVCPACKQDWTTPAKPVGRLKKHLEEAAAPRGD
jgi:predicted Zn-ribbon and HTH transcriptional regulator